MTEVSSKDHCGLGKEGGQVTSKDGARILRGRGRHTGIGSATMSNVY